MEKTDEKLASLIEKLQEAGFAQAPEVIDGAIRAIQFDGLLALVGAGFFGALFIIAIITLLYGAANNNSDLMGIGGFGSVLTLLMTALIGSIDNPWLRVFDPEAALYQQMIEGIF